MKVDTWCKQTGITKANYYYRLRRVREVCLPLIANVEDTSFVELKTPADQRAGISVTKSNPSPAAVLYCPAGIQLELFNSASSEFLSNVIGVLAHAE